MVQAVIDLAMLPDSPVASGAAFHRSHLDAVTQRISEPDVTALVIVMPLAGPDHDHWRRTLARDLAREHSPKRCNIVAAGSSALKQETLAYLRDAPGVTGQYLVTYD